MGPSLSNQDILSTVNRWVTDNSSRQASFSAGECELLAYAAGFTASLDNALAQAAAQGQTLFTSSGDTGAACPAVVGVNGVPAGLPGVNYPASSPNAIGVGGTTVLSPSGTDGDRLVRGRRRLEPDRAHAGLPGWDHRRRRPAPGAPRRA